VKELFTEFSTDPTTADQLVKANPAIFTGSEVWFVHTGSYLTISRPFQIIFNLV